MLGHVPKTLGDRAALLAEAGRVARFGVTGGCAALAYIAVSFAGVEALGVAPLPASTLGMLAAASVSYVGHRAFSFRVPPDHRAYLPRFLVALVAAYLAQAAIMTVATTLLRLPYLIGLIAVALTLPLVTYLINRLWVFGSGIRASSRR
jgi:putative flippase GtrA